MDPVTKVVRDGSLLNQVAWVRLDPSLLSEETRAQAAEGIVAYSAICTHQGCPISMWHQPRVRRGPVPRPRASDPLPDPVAQAAAERRRPAGRVEGHDGNADPRPLRQDVDLALPLATKTATQCESVGAVPRNVF